MFKRLLTWPLRHVFRHGVCSQDFIQGPALILPYSHVRRIDSQLDSFRLVRIVAPSDLHSASDGPRQSSDSGVQELDDANLRQLMRLQTAIEALSSVSSLRANLDPPAILAILRQGELLDPSSNPGSVSRKDGSVSSQQQDLEWLLISKATAQVYGLVLNLLLDQTIPLTSDIEYWDKVLGSYAYTTLYTIQTSPLRLWRWIQDVYDDACNKLQSTDGRAEQRSSPATSLSNSWGHFYRLVRDSIRERSSVDMQSRSMSPLTMSQVHVKSKRRHLKRLWEMSASGLGVLVDEGMMFDLNDEDSITSKARSDEKEEWKSVVSKSVSLMEAVLHHITALEMGE